MKATHWSFACFVTGILCTYGMARSWRLQEYQDWGGERPLFLFLDPLPWLVATVIAFVAGSCVAVMALRWSFKNKDDGYRAMSLGALGLNGMPVLMAAVGLLQALL